MDVQKALSGHRKLMEGQIPADEELEELYCLASSPKADVPEDIKDESFREFFGNRPRMRCLGILGAYAHLISRTESSPEISTYVMFKAVTIVRLEEVGAAGRGALEDFLESYCLSERDVEMYMAASGNRN